VALGYKLNIRKKETKARDHCIDVSPFVAVTLAHAATGPQAVCLIADK